MANNVPNIRESWMIELRPRQELDASPEAVQHASAPIDLDAVNVNVQRLAQRIEGLSRLQR